MAAAKSGRVTHVGVGYSSFQEALGYGKLLQTSSNNQSDIYFIVPFLLCLSC
ncbi:MAG: hypothetical protein HC835_19745 [Oscillatoriales cyanobacterium RM2_1_1]|nr:hypothetical protein [Oscillatoriales cyanobacterium SM2_3_0]NJO47649.1 hypothetical protein [Oscillatoriales cyanobacterium RM2_1_1]